MSSNVVPAARIPLTALGGDKLVWRSDSLPCRQETGVDYAFASEGEHRITVTNAETGQRAEVQISVQSL